MYRRTWWPTTLVAVADVLTAAGWPGAVGADAAALGLAVEPFPAAVAAVAEFGGLCVVQTGAGVDVRRRPFVLDPALAAASGETLSAFGAVLGCRLFPLGVEGDHESILAIAETGHVIALDHTGEWHLGDSMADALTTLVTGTLPARVRADGTW